MGTRAILTGLALGRVAIGAALMAAPDKLVGSGWVGDVESRRPTTQLLMRGLGARDVALGLGMLISLRQGSSLKALLIGASLADATDLAATLAAGPSVPTQGRVGAGIVAGGAVVAQLALLPAVD
jgi:hypothetical protein